MNVDYSLHDWNNEFGVTKAPMVQLLPEFRELLLKYIELQPQKVLEIGTQHGGSLYYWTKYSQPHSQIISIDIDHNPLKLQKPELWENKERLTLLTADSTDINTRNRICEITGSRLDFLFIDGNHAEPYPTLDFNMYAPLVRSGGIIAMHDINGSPDGDGVTNLWRKIKDENRWKTEELLYPNAQWFGIGVVYI